MRFTKLIEVEDMSKSETGVVVGSLVSVEALPCDGWSHSVKDGACDSVRTLKRKSLEIGSNLVDVSDRTDRKKRAIQKDRNTCHHKIDGTQFSSAEMENRFGCSRKSLDRADYIPLPDDETGSSGMCDDTHSSSGYLALSDDAHSNASTIASLTTCGDNIRPHFCSGSWRYFNDVDNLMELMLDDSWGCFNVVDDLMELMIGDGVVCSSTYLMVDNYVALSDLVVTGHLDTDEKELDSADYIPLPDDTVSSSTTTFGDNTEPHYRSSSWRCFSVVDDIMDLINNGAQVVLCCSVRLGSCWTSRYRGWC